MSHKLGLDAVVSSRILDLGRGLISPSVKPWPGFGGSIDLNTIRDHECPMRCAYCHMQTESKLIEEYRAGEKEDQELLLALQHLHNPPEFCQKHINPHPVHRFDAFTTAEPAVHYDHLMRILRIWQQMPKTAILMITTKFPKRVATYLSPDMTNVVVLTTLSNPLKIKGFEPKAPSFATRVAMMEEIKHKTPWARFGVRMIIMGKRDIEPMRHAFNRLNKAKTIEASSSIVTTLRTGVPGKPKTNKILAEQLDPYLDLANDFRGYGSRFGRTLRIPVLQELIRTFMSTDVVFDRMPLPGYQHVSHTGRASQPRCYVFPTQVCSGTINQRRAQLCCGTALSDNMYYKLMRICGVPVCPTLTRSPGPTDLIVARGIWEQVLFLNRAVAETNLQKCHHILRLLYNSIVATNAAPDIKPVAEITRWSKLLNLRWDVTSPIPYLSTRSWFHMDEVRTELAPWWKHQGA